MGSGPTQSSWISAQRRTGVRSGWYTVAFLLVSGFGTSRTSLSSSRPPGRKTVSEIGLHTHALKGESCWHGWHGFVKSTSLFSLFWHEPHHNASSARRSWTPSLHTNTNMNTPLYPHFFTSRLSPVVPPCRRAQPAEHRGGGCAGPERRAGCAAGERVRYRAGVRPAAATW